MYVNLEEEEEDFQTISLDDEHWNMEEIPDRHLCTHEHFLPHGLCPYPCPYSDYQASSYPTMTIVYSTIMAATIFFTTYILVNLYEFFSIYIMNLYTGFYNFTYM